MGSVSTYGLDDVITTLAEVASLPVFVVEKMLNAKADVIEPAQHQSAESMGVHRTGDTEGSIKRTKVTATSDGHVLSIYPQGINTTGTRNAEVAFVNEFGTSSQDARPFIDTANRASADKAYEAAAKVYNDYLRSKNL